MKVRYPAAAAIKGCQVLILDSQSDHPVLNSRYLLYEAQQAHFYGLPENLAIASVTSNSAEVMGMGHRIGYIKEGYDAGKYFVCCISSNFLIAIYRPSNLG